MTYLVLALGILAAVYLLVRLAVAVHSYRQLRGKMLVTCPETKQPASVDVDALHAALAAAGHGHDLHLKDCCRWPERKACGQECLAQIESAPADCLVRNIVIRWYEGKSCVLCGKPIGTVDWFSHKAALMSRDHVTAQWNEVPAERLPEVFKTYWAVCWDCHIAEKFRRMFPDATVDRKRTGSGLVA